MKHITSIDALGREEVDKIVKGAREMIPYAKQRSTPDQAKIEKKPKVCLLFLEPSTRTLGSYEEAARLLGWPTRIISGPESTSLAKKESFANTARMLAIQGAQIIVIRSREEGVSTFIAEVLERAGFSQISIQNAGDGAHEHPSQTLLDRLTILETLGRLKNFTFGFLGDLKYSRTVHSLLKTFAPEDNVRFKLVSCPETRLPEEYKRGLNVFESQSVEDLKDCDIVYVTRIQEERYSDPVELKRVKGRYRITLDILERWKKDVKIMHPLPYVDEISPEIRFDRRLILDKQSWYGIPTRMYLLLWSQRNRFEKTVLSGFPEVEKKIIKEVNINEYLAGRKKGERYFRPLRNGTVLDHLESGTAEKIERYLKTERVFREDSVIHSIENVPSQKLKRKDVLILENVFLPDRTLALISFIAPQTTFNIVRDNRIRKMKVEPPKEVYSQTSFLRCPNSHCVVNHDPEARPRFKILKKEGKEIVRCNYCEREFSREEVLRTI